MLDGSIIEAEIVNGLTYLPDGSRPPDGAVVETNDGYFMMINGSGVKVTPTAVSLPNGGGTVTGYIANNITYMIGGSRPAVDSIVHTSGGSYLMTNNGGEKVDGSYVWPTVSTVITSPYGMRGNAFHDGIDIRGSVGTPVYAVESGTVTIVKWDSNDKSWYGNKSYQGVGGGYYITITSSNNAQTTYMHLQADSALVKVGDQVYAGQPIANTGKTGNGSPHLHFRVRIDGKRQTQNPALLTYYNMS